MSFLIGSVTLYFFLYQHYEIIPTLQDLDDTKPNVGRIGDTSSHIIRAAIVDSKKPSTEEDVEKMERRQQQQQQSGEVIRNEEEKDSNRKNDDHHDTTKEQDQLQQQVTSKANKSKEDSSSNNNNENEMNIDFSFFQKDAIDEDGNPGYIHDTAYVKNHPLPFQNENGVCNFKKRIPDILGTAGIEGLRKIHVMKNDNNSESNNKVLCIVYTHSGNHPTLLRAIVETYAQRCDGFLAASNTTDPSLGAVHILHAGPESYDNMWQKVRSIWGYVADHYLDKYDWFHIGGDDMYVIPDNLRYAMKKYDKENEGKPLGKREPYFIGMALIPQYQGKFLRKKRRICGGGSGYTLNREALARLSRILESSTKCAIHDITSQEDFLISECLRSHRVALCTNDDDEYNEMRYHALSAQYHATWKNYGALWSPKLLEEHHNITSSSKEGLESISNTSISFHLVGRENATKETKAVALRRYHALVYDGYC